jgi:hypothetical protein
MQYADGQSAKGSSKGMLKPIPTDSVRGSFETKRYGRNDDGRHGLIITVQNVVAHIEGPDR